jgi:RimJ/RimL family protein N-acetyltransferase
MERLELSPLRVTEAEEMVHVLADETLYEFIGGIPPTVEELRARYERQVAGNPGRDSVWMNWVIRRRSDGQPVGTLQAELFADDRSVARVAWIVGVQYQGQGFASEAVAALVAWLEAHGVDEVRAHIHPRHLASMAVAMRAGLVATDDSCLGETVWRRRSGPRSGSRPA